MTPSVSPQTALTDWVIFAATVFAAVALSLGPGPPHGAIVVMARCSAVPNDKLHRVAADCSRDAVSSYECELASILIVIVTPFFCNAGKLVII